MDYTDEQTYLRDSKQYAQEKPPYFLYAFTFLAALGGFLFGYDTGIISGAIILIREVSQSIEHGQFMSCYLTHIVRIIVAVYRV